MSDHISGPRALADPIADITDVYAFPSPDRPGSLVLVLNTLPMAKPSDAFSEGLLYRFRLRALATPRPGTNDRFAPGEDEVILDCIFDASASSPDGADHEFPSDLQGSCVSPAGERITFRV